MLDFFLSDLVALFNEELLGQSFGIIAMFTLLYGFFQVNDTKSKYIIFSALIFWLFHFLILDLLIPTVTTLIALCKVGLSIKFEKNIYLCITIMLITVTFGILNFESIYHVLPVIASTIGTVNFFYFHGILFRSINIMNASMRLVYSFIFGSIGGMISHSLTIFILLIAIIRIVSYTGYFHKYKMQLDKIIHIRKRIDHSDLGIGIGSHRILKEKSYLAFISKGLKSLGNLQIYKLRK